MMIRKILFLVENVVDSGGNRVIAIKIKNEIKKGNIVEVAVIQRKLTKPKDILGLIKDIISSKIAYKQANKVFLLNKPIETSNYDEVITTGRRGLLFLQDITESKHLHLFQHIEAWDTLNSDYFFNFCKNNGYPSGSQTIEVLRENKVIEELIYIYRLSFLKKVETVSLYLKEIIHSLNPKSTVIVNEPPEIGLTNSEDLNIINTFEYDLLFFVRGLKFKGDDLHIKLMRIFYSKGLRIAIVCSKKRKYYNFIKSDYENCSFFFQPLDLDLYKIYKKSRIFVSCSVSEGFGATVREAYNNGLICVTSNVGWVQNNELFAKDRLHIVKKHDFKEYVSKIETLI